MRETPGKFELGADTKKKSFIKSSIKPPCGWKDCSIEQTEKVSNALLGNGPSKKDSWESPKAAILRSSKEE